MEKSEDMQPVRLGCRKGLHNYDNAPVHTKSEMRMKLSKSLLFPRGSSWLCSCSYSIAGCRSHSFIDLHSKFKSAPLRMCVFKWLQKLPVQRPQLFKRLQCHTIFQIKSIDFSNTNPKTNDKTNTILLYYFLLHSQTNVHIINDFVNLHKIFPKKSCPH